MEKMAWDGPKWGREDFFLANPGLANILGRTDLYFANLYFFHFLDPKFLDSQVPRSPKSGLGQAWAGWASGRAWALGRVGPRAGVARAAHWSKRWALGWAGPGLGLGPGGPSGRSSGGPWAVLQYTLIPQPETNLCKGENRKNMLAEVKVVC